MEVASTPDVISPARAKLREKPIRSVFKWAGGKGSVLTTIAQHLPAGKRLIEPFVGGGSLFMNFKFPEYLCGDINNDLIVTYQVIQSSPDALIAALVELFDTKNTADGYAGVRKQFNLEKHNMPLVARAACFVFINRHCFNGLMRYNLAGAINTSYGKYKAPYLPVNEIKECHSVAARCIFTHQHFQETIAEAGAGDVVFCDPPYEPLPGKEGFTTYSSGGFRFSDQEALMDHLSAAYQRGADVIITNSRAPNVVELYVKHGMTIHQLDAPRTLSCKGGTRHNANDILAAF
ncbi:Dam family site-specific DNA-(adenine-N6)-methyltransferase [Serratia sp. CC22-02]|uniref:DNA adenine methylase n=1 Tax=Serratia sp. CC22-02 TaxID=1378076 RepID=UPI0024B67892|nr:Dam family site-specific DNA-(adenine-N6)-methyltransferase [Serratia sp. CC22-02]